MTESIDSFLSDTGITSDESVYNMQYGVMGVYIFTKDEKVKCKCKQYYHYLSPDLKTCYVAVLGVLFDNYDVWFPALNVMKRFPEYKGTNRAEWKEMCHASNITRRVIELSVLKAIGMEGADDVLVQQGIPLSALPVSPYYKERAAYRDYNRYYEQSFDPANILGWHTAGHVARMRVMCRGKMQWVDRYLEDVNPMKVPEDWEVESYEANT